MKMPSLRFNVRRVAIALLVVGLVVVLEIGRRRRGVFLEKAGVYSVNEESFRLAAKLTEENPPAPKPDLPDEDGQDEGPSAGAVKEDLAKKIAERKARAAALREKADVQARLREKYEKAASFPWLPVTPDPDEPIEPEGPPEPAYGTPKSARGAPAKTKGAAAKAKKAASTAKD